MMNSSNAAAALVAVLTERAALQAEVDRLRGSRQQIAEQLAQAQAGRAVVADEAAAAARALSDTITAHALGDCSADDLDAARSRARAAKAAADRQDDRGLTGAELQASIDALDQRMGPMGVRLFELSKQEGRLAVEWLRECGGSIHARQQDLTRRSAALAAEAVALNRVASLIGAPEVFAPPYLPRLIADGWGGGDRIVVDVDSLVPDATQRAISAMKAAGFTVI